MKKLIIIATILVLITSISKPINAKIIDSTCSGRMLNPITDICWDCIFPISIGAVEMPPSTHTRPDTENYPSPVCACPKLAGIEIPGIAMGHWDPVRMIDVTKKPFCMVNLGGVPMDGGFLKELQGSSPSQTNHDTAKWQIHYFVNPITGIMNIITDILCLEPLGSMFDLAYITEIDPLWNIEILSFLINPEAILFANPIAQLACAADCVSASAFKPLDFLFWCSGCQGSLYPMTGNIAEHVGSIQSSTLAIGKLIHKLHRQLMGWNTSGPEAICYPVPWPIIKKSQYRLQTTFPIPGIGPYGCNPIGRTTVIHESFKETPIKGEDFGYFLWRKKNCCVL